MMRQLPTIKKFKLNELLYSTCAAVVKFLGLIALNAVCFQYSFSQIVITQNSNADSLSQMLVGSGVTISNITMNCNTVASGKFNNVSSDIGLTQGIVMATGKVSSIPQPASSFASTALTGAGDAQLSTLTSGPIYDPCVLEFDVVPQGDTLQFKYVFASEEYPEFVCSQFNDVFGFFITGPNPAGGSFTNVNIATLPNSTMPVCINSVNDGISGTYNGTTWNSNGCMSLGNTSDYVNNLTPVNPYIVYNGMTKVLNAVSAVVPCQSYHLKIAIADVGDRFYDSGVFLQAYSITSTPYTVAISSAINNPAYSAAYRGCMNGTFTVSISQAQSVPVTINLNISGTAVNGVDYSNIPSSVTIPAGQTSVTIPVTALQTGVTGPAVTVTLAVLNQCSGLPTTSASITIMDAPIATLAVTDTILCLGHSTQFTATGGASYSWSPATGLSSANIANPVATPLVTTTYSVITTWGTCLDTFSQTIHVNPPVALVVSPTDTFCLGSTVQLSVTAPSALTPYSYVWSNGSTLNTITISVSGTYSVSGTDGYGCTAAASKSLVELNPVLTPVTTSVSCFSGSNGSVELTASGGLAPYAFNWANGSTGANLSNLVAGTYNVTVIDSKGCSVTGAFNVAQPPSALSAIPVVSSDVSCFAGNNGAINLNVTGGTPPYNYNWAGGVITQNRSNLIGGNYFVTVTDSKGCTATATATITQPAEALSAAAAVIDISCAGDSTGAVFLSVSGGTNPYTYNWGGGISSQNITGLVAGPYTVTITDANGCSIANSSVITQPAVVLNATATPTGVSCFGDNGGSVSLNVLGGTAPYFYTWNDGATIPDISHLVAGNYFVTVTDANGCSVSISSVITQPTSALTATATTNNVSCFGSNNGSINVSVTGGTTPYTFNWGGGVVTQNRSNLAAGTYTVTVTDSKGCSTVSSATITQPAAALAVTAAATNINCFGGNTGAINLTVTGGTTPYLYNWGGGVTSQNRASLAAGPYTVTITDANGCSITNSSTITQPVAALAVSAAPVDVACFGNSTGSVNLTVSGGTSPYVYSWSNGSSLANITSADAGTYAVTVTDNKGCSTTASTVITQPASALTATATTNNVSCFGSNNGNINISVAGGTTPYTFNWGGGVVTQNRTNLAAGTYTVTVIDSKGCSTVSSATITQPAAALSSNIISNNVSCFGGNSGSANANVSGGTSPYAYTWSDGASTSSILNLGTGTYPVTVTDAKGCSVTGLTTITQPAAALTLSAAIVNIGCFGADNGSVALTVAGGTPAYLYTWSNGATLQNLTNLAPGNYSVTVTDTKGCSGTLSNNITQPVAQLAVTGTSTSINCYSGNTGTINLTVSGGTTPYTFTWADGGSGQNRSNLAAGNYSVTVTDGHACSALFTTTLTQATAALSLSANTNPVACFGAATGTINLQVIGGTAPYAYHWNNGATLQNPTGVVAGSYSVSVTDANACSATTSAVVSQPAGALAASINNTTPVLCYGNQTGVVGLTVTGGTQPYSYNWSNGSTSQSLSHLSAGTYSVEVSDANGCTAAALSTVIQPASGLTDSVVTGAVGCYAANNGSITLNANGGTAPYVFHWGDGSSLQNRNNLVSGTYLVTITDANGCTLSSTAVITQPVGALVATSATSQVMCFGGNTGSAQLSVTGGTAPYSFLWSNGSSAGNITNLSAGSYGYTVHDANACSVAASVVITQPTAALGASTNSSAINCFGTSTGSIDLQAAGGTAPYTYNWGGGITTSNRNNLATGIYTATITDANNCSVTTSDTITQPASAVTASSVSNNVFCYGDSTGSIVVTATGGTAPYTYIWSDGSNSLSRSNLTPGNYNLTVTDAHACSATVSSIITQPAHPIQALAAVTNVACNPGNTGAINLTVTGGTPPYQFKWAGGPTTQNWAQIGAGTYTVSITDANQCMAVNQVVVTQPAPLSLSLGVTEVSCNGGNNGAIVTSTTGGTTPYNYNWGGGITSPNRNQLSAGNYALTLTDANNCSVTAATTLSQPAAAIAAGASVSNVSCYGGNNGSIRLSVTGGSQPYSFVWNGGDTTQNRNNLIAGNYSVSISDINGCNTMASATITQPSALSATTNPSGVNCYGDNTGSVGVTVAGGTAPYNYIWSLGQTTSTIASLNAGGYSVSVTDANACSTSASATVGQPVAPIHIAATVTEVKCFGGDNGSIQLNVTGGTPGYSFVWSNGSHSQNLAGIAAGSYRITVTDSKGCAASVQEGVSQPLSAISMNDVTHNVSCFGGDNGSVNLNVSGGTSPYTYNWGSGVTTQNRNNIAAGHYDVTVLDANSCSATLAANINQPAAALATAVNIANVNCNGGNNGSIQLNVTGGTAPYIYSWSGGVTTQNRNHLQEGVYWVTIIDANGCSATASANITQPASGISPSIAVLSEVKCHQGDNGAVELNIAGGTSPYVYHWSNGSSTENQNNLSAGSYRVTITDHNGCTAIDSVTITQPQFTLSATAQPKDIACHGQDNGAINLTVQGGTPAYSYNWSGGITTQNRSNLAAGSYMVTVTDHNGCTATALANITQPASGISVQQTVTPATCYNSANGTALVNATGGTSPYSFSWAGGSNSQGRSMLSAGNYPLTVTDANGCSTTADVVVTAPDSISLSPVLTSPTCYNTATGSVQVNATGGTPGYYYAWNTGGSTYRVNDASAGSYSVTVTDKNGCSAGLTSIILTQPAQIDVAVNVVSGSCAGVETGHLAAVVTGGTAPYRYGWSDHQFTAGITHLAAGNYTVTVTDANFCTQTANAVINTYPGVSGTGNTAPLPCQNATGAIDVNVTSGTAPYSFKWNNGDTTQDIYHVHPGTYTVTITDADGCSFDTSFTIDNLNDFSVQATGGGTIVLGGSAEVHVTSTGSGQTAYNWVPGGTLSCATCPNALAQPVETTTYTVIGTDTNGCTASDTVSVIVIEDHDIFIPNAFTPNGDGNNDYFQIFGNLAGIHSMEVKIFDRWGEKVFQSENPEFKWDGTYKGVLQNPNVYVYEMKIVFDDGHSDELKKGSITLIR